MRRLPGPLRCKLSRETLLAYLTSLDAAPPFRLRKEMSTKVTLCFDGNLAAGSLELAAGLEALGRVELPTNGLGNRCSIHLSYRAMSGGSRVQLAPLLGFILKRRAPGDQFLTSYARWKRRRRFAAQRIRAALWRRAAHFPRARPSQ